MTNERRSPRKSSCFPQAASRHKIARRSALVVFLLAAGPYRVESQPQQDAGKPIVHEAVTPHVYEPGLRQMAVVRAYKAGDPVKVVEDLKEGGEKPGGEKSPASGPVTPKTNTADMTKMPKTPKYRPGDPVRVAPDLRESAASPAVASPVLGPGSNIFPVGASFDGIPATGFLPPDVAGAVGSDQYILMVNVAFAIFDKQGNLLVGPSPINALWAGFGGPCTTNNNGDPIVRYDHLADRWLMSQFALPGGAAGFHQCVAISRTADPVTGGWFLYDFPMINTGTGTFVFPDYPKFGVWPDGYYMGTQRGFPGGGLDVWSFEREKMLVGAPARAVQFAVAAPSLFLLPADLDGPAPPTGTPEFYGRQVDGARFGGANRLEIFAFHVDWSNPATSTFGIAATLPTAPFSSAICQGSFLEPCIPQPVTPIKLEALSVWTMWRLQYRNFGGHETLLTNHTVNAGGTQAGIRWYELRRPPGGPWSIFQQGTHSPDNSTSRWMGSIAMNRTGEVALGYSASSTTVFPSIRYAARLATDPPGTLGTEVNLMAGGGSQTFGIPRWGNYTTMDVDPKDDCTFWYAGEYMPSTSPAGWRTHISSFKSPGCGVAATYMYSAKIVCGLQKNREDVRLARGFYATDINIHNPSDAGAIFTKKLALTIPPGDQTPGKVLPIAKDKLGPDEALEVDCEDLRHKLFPGGFPSPYIEGFVVIESNLSLDVTAVYTTAALDEDGRAIHHSGIEVMQVHERVVKP
jgi:hypothetical protein